MKWGSRLLEVSGEPGEGVGRSSVKGELWTLIGQENVQGWSCDTTEGFWKGVDFTSR